VLWEMWGGERFGGNSHERCLMTIVFGRSLRTSLQFDGFALWLCQEAFVAGTGEIPVLACAGRVDKDVDRGDCSGRL
jgi:hypothetical protein